MSNAPFSGPEDSSACALISAFAETAGVYSIFPLSFQSLGACLLQRLSSSTAQLYVSSGHRLPAQTASSVIIPSMWTAGSTGPGWTCPGPSFSQACLPSLSMTFRCEHGCLIAELVGMLHKTRRVCLPSVDLPSRLQVMCWVGKEREKRRVDRGYICARWENRWVPGEKRVLMIWGKVCWGQWQLLLLIPPWFPWLHLSYLSICKNETKNTDLFLQSQN